MLGTLKRGPRAATVLPLATALFDYPLPPESIAQHPAANRDQSRLMVIERATRTVQHCVFADLPRFLKAGDTLFRNNAAVLPARLHAVRPTGGQVECFLLRPSNETTWRCLIRPGKKLPVGARFQHAAGVFTGTIVSREADGSAQVRFETLSGRPINEVATEVGDVPLPPYIERAERSPNGASTWREQDVERYQTVYANGARRVAVAAPTAGLHFTSSLLATLAQQGVRTADVTLHVGLGTFRPITASTVEAHEIHRELYEIPAATQQALFAPATGRRIAVGTTSVRTIEDFLSHHTTPLPDEQTCFGEAGIFIYPPRPFLGADALITNFHQPRSTLLCLVAAFLAPGSSLGIAWLHELYALALRERYRFLSYGDAMLIL